MTAVIGFRRRNRLGAQLWWERVISTRITIFDMSEEVIRRRYRLPGYAFMASGSFSNTFSFFKVTVCVAQSLIVLYVCWTKREFSSSLVTVPLDILTALFLQQSSSLCQGYSFLVASRGWCKTPPLFQIFNLGARKCLALEKGVLFFDICDLSKQVNKQENKHESLCSNLFPYFKT